MKFSIVTISFNQVRFLERTILSVLNQKYRDLEYIIVDAGSIDGSREIIERYRKDLSKVIYEKDNGPADGLNKGFSFAQGEVCGYINADDAYLPGAFGKISAAFEKNPTVDIVHGHGYIVDGDNRVIRRLHSDYFNLRRYAYGGVSVMQQSTFFKRKAFLEVGGFNVQNRTCWDGELILDFALRGKKFMVLDDFLSIFRIHGSSISGSGKLNTQYRQDLQRLFFKVYGRNKSWQDLGVVLSARIQKWLLNPNALRARLADIIFKEGKVVPQ